MSGKALAFLGWFGIVVACSNTPTSTLARCPTACGAQGFCQHEPLPLCTTASDAGTACMPGCAGCAPFIDNSACLPFPDCTDTTTCECLVALCGSCGGSCGTNGSEYELQCYGC